MSKFKKAVERLKSRPKDFTWDELKSLMAGLGYEEHKGQARVESLYIPRQNMSSAFTSLTLIAS